MKLIYRGATYHYDPSQARAGNTGLPVRPTQLSHAPYTLIYRGLTTLVDPAAAPPVAMALPAAYNLVYRGVAVNVNRNVNGQAIATAQPVGTVRENSTARSNATAVVASAHPSLGSVHQANLLNNVQRRLDVARKREDLALVALLESERQQITA